MKLRLIGLTAISLICMAAHAAEPNLDVVPSQLLSKPSYPVVRDGGYVLIEIWPVVKDITLSAFFLHESDAKSRNMCEAVKRSLDRDAKTRAREQKTTFTSNRQCMTIRDAARQGWIEAKE